MNKVVFTRSLLNNVINIKLPAVTLGSIKKQQEKKKLY